MKRHKPLKRTPMKPARSTLKRTGKLKSKPVSARKGRDAGAIAAYMAAHPYCEFKKSGAFDPPGGHWDSYEPHHTARIKCDDDRILVSVCTACHSYLHDTSDPSFVVLCLWQKLQDKNLDLEFLNSKSRFGNVLAYITRDHAWLDDGIVEMRDEVVRFSEKGK